MAQPVPSGSVSGTVYGEKAPLPAATLILKAPGAGFSKSTMSDSTGGFLFTAVPYGTYELHVSHVGYTTVKTSPLTIGPSSPRVRQEFALTGQERALKKVTIEAHRMAVVQRLDHLEVNVSSLLSASGGNALDVLENVPGIAVDETGNITVRGKQGASVYIDGRQVQLSGQDLVNYLRSLPASSLQVVQVFPIPPASFSAEGTGGLIRIMTKKDASSGWSGSFSQALGQGKYNKNTSTALLNYGSPKWRVYTGLWFSSVKNYYQYDRYRSYEDGTAAPTETLSQSAFERNYKESYVGRLGLDYTLSSQSTVSILGEGLWSPYGEIGLYRNAYAFPDASKDYHLFTVSQMHEPTREYSINVNYHHLDEKARELTLDLDLMHYHLMQSQVLQSTSDTAATPGEQLASYNPFTADIYSVKLDYACSLYGVKLETGAQSLLSVRASEGIYTSATPADPIDSLNNQVHYREFIPAVYANVRKQWKQLSLQGGLRLEDSYVDNRVIAQKPGGSFSLHYLKAFPTAYLGWKLDSAAHNQLTFSAGKRINRPSYQSLNPSLFFFDRSTGHGGNSLLGPEFSTRLEAGYSHGRWLNFSLSYAVSRGDIETGYLSSGGALLSIPQNLIRFQNLSANLVLSLKPASWWTFSFTSESGYSRYRGRDFTTGDMLTMGFPYELINMMQELYFQNGWRAELSGNLRTRVPGWESQGLPYAQIHTGVEKKFSGHFSARFSVRDLLHSWHINREILIPGIRLNTFLEGDTRWANLVVTYRFGKHTEREQRHTGIEKEAGRAGM